MSSNANTARRMIDIDMVASSVAKEVYKRYSFFPETEPQNTSRTRAGDEYFDLKIPESYDYGIFKAVMKSAHLRVRVGKVKAGEEDEHLCVFMALHYEHVGGGTNGANIGTMWIDYDGNLIGFREG